ncbi:MAG: helix-turn-helix domain-containing protein [Aquisalimonadaceae bacterium]
MSSGRQHPVRTLMVAIPETAGSALYGLLDVLCAAGTIWPSLVGAPPGRPFFEVGIVAESRAPFTCGNGIPVVPSASLVDDPRADVVIIPEIWLAPTESISGRHPELIAWIRRQYNQGANVYSGCSGAILLAETGLLDGCQATSHWGYQELFRRDYPRVCFRPEPNLAFADPAGRIVTAGGTTSWHDLALHIIARHASPAEAMRIAKVYLLKWHDEGQLPYAALVRHSPHGDAVVRACEQWLETHYQDSNAVHNAVVHAGIPERTLKRRFHAATGSSLIARLQGVRIERAKHLLEQGSLPVDEISATVGYEDASFFRRLFRRNTGLTPSQYRRMFRPLMTAGEKG